jgi:hypothetical protein
MESQLTLLNYKCQLIQYIRELTGLTYSALENVFIRWIFVANVKGHLNIDLVPTTNIVSMTDIHFLLNNPKNISYPKDWKLKILPNQIEFTPFTGPNESELYLQKIKERNSYQLTNIQLNRLKSLREQNLEKQSLEKQSLEEQSNFKFEVNKLLDVYLSLGGLQNLLSFPLGLFQNPNLYIECFGSPLNTQYRYCSAFPFEKETWNSLGSFFDLEIKTGKYIANPPFDDDIMTMMARKLVTCLKKETNTLLVLVIIPVWDPETQIELNAKNFETKFDCLDILKESGFIKNRKVMKYREYGFYNYTLNKYESKAHFHFIQLDNYTKDSPCNFEEIVKKWEQLSKSVQVKKFSK